MGVPVQSLPVIGQNNSTEDPKIRSCLLELQQLLDKSQTGLVGDNLATSLAQYLGVSDASSIRRGKVNIATTETRTNTAYGLMTTPDQVSNIVLPTDGLIAIAYQAVWNESVASAARAAIFLNSNQLKIYDVSSGAAAVQETSLGGTVSTFTSLSTSGQGLLSPAASTHSDPEVTTGQIIGTKAGVASGGGGVCYVYAAAGTYTVSVQFKSSSGSVQAASRHLWVWTVGF